MFLSLVLDCILVLFAVIASNNALYLPQVGLPFVFTSVLLQSNFTGLDFRVSKDEKLYLH